MRCLNKFLVVIALFAAPVAVCGQEQAAPDTSTYRSQSRQDADLATEPENRTSSREDNDYSASSHAARYVQPRNTEAPSDGKWGSLTSDNDFDYKQDREYVKQSEKVDFKPPVIPWWLRAISSFFGFFTTIAGQAILWAIVALIVGLIIYRLVSGGGGFFARRDRIIRQKDAAGDDMSAEDLLQSDWEARLRAASQAGDYRLAIRYGYLLLLQLLQKRELIAYRQDKTNTDYYRELSDTRAPLKPGFRTLTRAYEWAWYSGEQPAQHHAEAYLNDFNQIKASL